MQYMALQEEPYNQSHLCKLDEICRYLNFFGEHFKAPFQEPELLSLMAETAMNVMESIVRCRYQSEPELNGDDHFDGLNMMLGDLCHNFNGLEPILDDNLEPVGHEMISRYKDRICNLRTLISREILEDVIFFANILYNDKY